ncbi:hypothetical protein Ae706Ps2_6670c [Pseudonocardia sp. Ae706_Ps2]|nr:hypothetical protein Ae706Ps2_6670c [Pseudonocardia sp. Ae706_Ps2]
MRRSRPQSCNVMIRPPRAWSGSRRFCGRCGRGSRSRMWRRRRSRAGSRVTSSPSTRTSRGGGRRCCVRSLRMRRRVRGAGRVRGGSGRIPRCRGGSTAARRRWCSSRSLSV